MRRVLPFIAIAAGLLCLLGGSVSGDEFVLSTGAKIRGEWLNRQGRAAEPYRIRTESGGDVSLARSQVASVKTQSDAEQTYDRLAPGYADTIADQWKLAQWCRRHGLLKQREEHLRRVIELDPHHVAARRGLGYSEIGGQWVRQAEHLRQQGYVRYKGAWRLQQDIDLREKRRALEIAKKDWIVKLKRWRSQLTDRKKSRAALNNILAVRDPLAIDGLGGLLNAEPDRRVRLLLVGVLGQIEGNHATAALISHSLRNRDVEVFHECIEQLQPRSNPLVVDQFVQSLKSSDRIQVNRAAHALGQLGNPSVISPLIDALVTEHEIVQCGTGATTTSFSSGPQASESQKQGMADHVPVNLGNGQTLLLGPGGGWNVSSDGTRTQTRRSLNQEVLQSLVRLTGVSFSFDQQAWRDWLAVQQRQQRSQTTLNARRESG